MPTSFPPEPRCVGVATFVGFGDGGYERIRPSSRSLRYSPHLGVAGLSADHEIVASPVACSPRGTLPCEPASPCDVGQTYPCSQYLSPDRNRRRAPEQSWHIDGRASRDTCESRGTTGPTASVVFWSGASSWQSPPSRRRTTRSTTFCWRSPAGPSAGYRRRLSGSCIHHPSDGDIGANRRAEGHCPQ